MKTQKKKRALATEDPTDPGDTPEDKPLSREEQIEKLVKDLLDEIKEADEEEAAERDRISKLEKPDDLDTDPNLSPALSDIVEGARKKYTQQLEDLLKDDELTDPKAKEEAILNLVQKIESVRALEANKELKKRGYDIQTVLSLLPEKNDDGTKPINKETVRQFLNDAETFYTQGDQMIKAQQVRAVLKDFDEPVTNTNLRSDIAVADFRSEKDTTFVRVFSNSGSTLTFEDSTRIPVPIDENGKEVLPPNALIVRDGDYKITGDDGKVISNANVKVGQYIPGAALGADPEFYYKVTPNGTGSFAEKTSFEYESNIIGIGGEKVYSNVTYKPEETTSLTSFANNPGDPSTLRPLFANKEFPENKDEIFRQVARALNLPVKNADAGRQAALEDLALVKNKEEAVIIAKDRVFTFDTENGWQTFPLIDKAQTDLSMIEFETSSLGIVNRVDRIATSYVFENKDGELEVISQNDIGGNISNKSLEEALRLNRSNEKALKSYTARLEDVTATDPVTPKMVAQNTPTKSPQVAARTMPVAAEDQVQKPIREFMPYAPDSELGKLNAKKIRKDVERQTQFEELQAKQSSLNLKRALERMTLKIASKDQARKIQEKFDEKLSKPGITPEQRTKLETKREQLLQRNEQKTQNRLDKLDRKTNSNIKKVQNRLDKLLNPQREKTSSRKNRVSKNAFQSPTPEVANQPEPGIAKPSNKEFIPSQAKQANPIKPKTNPEQENKPKAQTPKLNMANVTNNNAKVSPTPIPKAATPPAFDPLGLDGNVQFPNSKPNKNASSDDEDSFNYSSISLVAGRRIDELSEVIGNNVPSSFESRNAIARALAGVSLNSRQSSSSLRSRIESRFENLTPKQRTEAQERARKQVNDFFNNRVISGENKRFSELQKRLYGLSQLESLTQKDKKLQSAAKKGDFAAERVRLIEILSKRRVKDRDFNITIQDVDALIDAKKRQLSEDERDRLNQFVRIK